MTTTRTGQQPGHHTERPHNVAPAAATREMTPYDIARSRLHDLAQGALPDLFDQASALHIARRLEWLEQHHDGLRRSVELLLTGLLGEIDGHRLDIQWTGPTPDLMQLARAINLIAKELNQP